HPDRGPDGAKRRGGRDAQGLEARRVEAERIADEVELAAEVRGLGLRGHPHRLAVEPPAKWREEPFSERLLELQGNRALAEANLLAGEAFAREVGGVG